MPQAAVQAPSFSTRTPEVLNSANLLSFSLPVLNTGAGVANSIVITGISLGSVAAQNPALPLPIGDLAAENVTAVNASFSSNGFTVGSNYLAVVRGTYVSGNATFGFTLNRYINVPAAVAAPIALLAAHAKVVVDLVAETWTYTVFNDEPANSPRYVNAISIDMAAPFTVTETPAGWAADTDGFSYVLWYATDTQLPYPHHIPPGSSLGGFQIQSVRHASEARGLTITSWNHQTDQADLTTQGSILTPSHT
jgi:hypothetical protein